MSDVGAGVYRCLQRHPGEPMTANEVATTVGCVRRTAHKHLSRLADEADVETKKVGSRARVWWLSPPDAEVYERITDAFFAVDTDWRFTHLNDQAERLLGRTADELRGRSIWEVFPEAVGSTFEREYRRAMETQESVSFEEHYPPLDTTFTVEGFPSETGLSVYFRNVTERVRREQEVHARVRQQHVIAQLGQRALAATDIDEFMHHVCETAADTLDVACCKVLDLHDEESELHLRSGVGWNPGVVGTATVPADTNSQAGYTLQQREPVRVEELSTETRFTGPPLLADHDVESGISVVIGSPEEPWGILGTHDTAVRSFSEQDADFVRSVAALLASAIDRHERERELERYETVFETLSDGVYTVDPEGRFTLVNEAYVEMTGWARAELLGSHVSALVDDDVRTAAKELEGALVEGRRQRATLEARLETKDGESFPAEATFSLLETSDGYERIGVVRDISARKRRENALREHRERVEQLNRLALRIFDAIRGAMRAETRDGVYRRVCERLVDDDTDQEAAIGTQRWTGDPVTTGSGEPWRDTGWRAAVPALVDEATDATENVVTDGDTAALPLRYDDRTFGVLVLRSERGGFDPNERALLAELGTAVGLAVSALERKNVLVNDSVATLEFTSNTLAAPFTEQIGPEASFEFAVDRIVPVGDDTYLTHYSVSGVEPAQFAAACEAFETVEATRVIDTDEAGPRVRLRTTDAALVSQFRRFDSQMRSARVEGGELSLTVEVPATNVRETVDVITETYPDLDLQSQRTTTRSTRTPTAFRAVVNDRLTERQSTALELACFSGYFDWPRTTDGAALAETMDISPPTFHKHLRLAQRRVFEALYESTSLIS